VAETYKGDKFKEDCEEHIYVQSNGAIVYQSILLQRHPDFDPNGRLMSIIEDHIFMHPGGPYFIDWSRVWEDYDA